MFPNVFDYKPGEQDYRILAGCQSVHLADADLHLPGRSGVGRSLGRLRDPRPRLDQPKVKAAPVAVVVAPVVVAPVKSGWLNSPVMAASAAPKD